MAGSEWIEKRIGRPAAAAAVAAVAVVVAAAAEATRRARTSTVGRMSRRRDWRRIQRRPHLIKGR